MRQSIAKDAFSTIELEAEVARQVDGLLAWLRPQLVELVLGLRAGPLSPATFCAWELQLVGLLREFGRRLLEDTLGSLEKQSSAGELLSYEGAVYRRTNRRTPNAFVATLCGTIRLWRFAYRPRDAAGEPCLFPLELRLGLLCGATPALTDLIGRQMAEAGATQSRVREFLWQEHGVRLGVKRLRLLVESLSAGLAGHRQAAQVEELLRALCVAADSRGNRKPVLAVGRDGITLREYRSRVFEVATAATVTVFDRAGHRLHTCYLASPPELGQATMSRMLTELLTAVLTQWDGPWPTLAYVTDSGDRETGYFDEVLRRMTHPVTGQPLAWQRVVDFYHAAERVWAMSEMLFGAGTPRYFAWARRMLRKLKRQRRGAKRVLHSAAALAASLRLGKTRHKKFRQAYEYLRRRTRWMRYVDYKAAHIPLGSGITEAACKTVFTQRLKLSGMRWTRAGAQQILTLRTVLLSHTWDATYAKLLAERATALPVPYAPSAQHNCRNAA